MAEKPLEVVAEDTEEGICIDTGGALHYRVKCPKCNHQFYYVPGEFDNQFDRTEVDEHGFHYPVYCPKCDIRFVFSPGRRKIAIAAKLQEEYNRYLDVTEEWYD